MKRFLLRAAKRFYRATPFRPVRQFYFDLFLRFVRQRRMVATVEGITFELDLGQLVDVGVLLEEYEPEVVAAMERWCRPGWCVLDVGANIGAHALRFARLVGPSGQVYAFEPTEFAYGKLVRNISLNAFANLEAFRVALSDENAMDKPVSIRSSWRTDGVRVDEATCVSLRRLDDWCAEHSVPTVDMIKLDVDGSEAAVLSGAPELLKRCKPLFLIEAGTWHFDDAARNPFHLLAGLGYRFWDAKTLEAFSGPDGIERAMPPVAPDMSFSFNVIAALAWPGEGTVVAPGG